MQNLPLTSFLKLKKPKSLFHMLQLWSLWRPLKSLLYISLSCARNPDLDPAFLMWSHQCRAEGQDQCLTLLLFLGTFSKGCFAAQVHCCLLGIYCHPGRFVQSCFCSISPSLSCCRPESFKGFEELRDVPSSPFLQPVQVPLYNSAVLHPTVHSC